MPDASLDKTRRIPLYQQCADIIREKIADGSYRPGEFIPSERQLSIDFGINRITLRKGLAELVRTGILENVPGAGNRVVGRSGASVSAVTIGFVMLRQVGTPALSPYYAEIISGIEEVITSAGHDLMYSSLAEEHVWENESEPLPADDLVNARFDGVILIGGLSDALADAYSAKGIPVVTVDRRSENDHVSSVLPDNEQGARLAARYLLDLGHDNIVFLSAPSDPVADARLVGLLKELEAASISLAASRILPGDYDSEKARAVLGRYLVEEEYDLPLAVVAINDEAAIGAMRAIREAGMEVPLDISVMGFDDILRAGDVEPSLTTVRIPRLEMGQCAAHMLLDRLQDPGRIGEYVVMDTELVVRDSCAAAE